MLTPALFTVFAYSRVRIPLAPQIGSRGHLGIIFHIQYLCQRQGPLFLTSCLATASTGQGHYRYLRFLHSQTAIIDGDQSVKTLWPAALPIVFSIAATKHRRLAITSNGYHVTFWTAAVCRLIIILGFRKVQEAAKQHMAASAKSSYLWDDRTRTCAAALMTNL